MVQGGCSKIAAARGRRREYIIVVGLVVDVWPSDRPRGFDRPNRGFPHGEAIAAKGPPSLDGQLYRLGGSRRGNMPMGAMIPTPSAWAPRRVPCSLRAACCVPRASP